MNDMKKPTNIVSISFLKKENGTSKFGPYVEMCYKAMIHLKNHKGYVVSDEHLYERNYIISLAYMMGTYDGKDEKMSGLIVGGDGNKSIFDNCMTRASAENEQIENTRTNLCFNTYYVAPDFIIHKNNKIKDINERNQKLVIEAKTKPSINESDFFHDFFKLNVYLSRLKFRYGIYLLINTPIAKINRYINEYITKNYYISEKCKNRMLFLIQEKESDLPSLYGFRMDPKTYQLKNNGNCICNIQDMVIEGNSI